MPQERKLNIFEALSERLWVACGRPRDTEAEQWSSEVKDGTFSTADIEEGLENVESVEWIAEGTETACASSKSGAVASGHESGPDAARNGRAAVEDIDTLPG